MLIKSDILFCAYKQGLISTLTNPRQQTNQPFPSYERGLIYLFITLLLCK